MEKKYFQENDTTFQEKQTKILVSFYNLDQILIYENQCSFDKDIFEIIKELYEKVSEEKLKSLLKVDKALNKKNLFFYVKTKDSYEKIDNKRREISSYIYNIHDTITLLLHKSSTAVTNNFNLKIYISIKNENIADKIEEYININTHLIGKPIVNKLKYYLYNKYTKELRKVKYSKEDITNLKLNNYSSLDTYCNAKNYLYIYESNSKCNYFESIDSNRFLSINLVTNKVNLISSNFPKRILHSMIYIPECYIFIIGGKDTRHVLVYKIKKDNINYEKYPFLLPKELLEPSLIYINNKYLYIFENSTLDFNILRINLNFISPFENIQLENRNPIPMNQKFFGVVKNKNSILFLGGQMLNSAFNPLNNCFEFHFNSNKLVVSKRNFQPLNFIEKTLIPIENNIYIQLTEFKKENKYEPKIIIFDGNSQEVQNSDP